MTFKTQTLALLVAAALVTPAFAHAADSGAAAAGGWTAPSDTVTANLAPAAKPVENKNWLGLPDINYSVAVPVAAVGVAILLLAKSRHSGTGRAEGAGSGSVPLVPHP